MPTELNVRFWKTGDETGEFNYPELTDPELRYEPILGRPNTGIAISGGGTVSASLIMGYFYALQEMEVFDNIRYISGVSGGCWGSAPFCYLPEDMDDTTYLGGKKYQPEDLTRDILKQVPEHSLTYAVTHACIVEKALLEIQSKHLSSCYVRAVGDIFLEPFNISKTDCYFTTDQNAVNQITGRNPGLNASDFITLKKGRPFPIMNTSIMSPKVETGSDNFPCDFTPLYAGVKTHAGKKGKLGQKIGGAFVEPFGFNCKPVKVDKKELMTIVSPGDERFSLCHPVGGSGDAIAQDVMEKHTVPNFILPSYKYWNPTAALAPLARHTYRLGDGGFVDDTGVAALLARGVENIVVFLTEPFDTTTEQYQAVGYNQISSLFGQKVYKWDKDPDKRGFTDPNPNNLMLEQEKFNALKTAVKQSIQAGGPVFWKDAYTVQENGWFGIDGGWTCNILWIFNSRSTGWNDRVKALLKDEFVPDFPFVKVFGQNPQSVINLTPVQANMLGNFGYWMSTSAEQEIRSLLG